MLTIEGATLADGRVRDVRIDPETGRIDAVGEDLGGTETVDATGKRLLPGMIDAHVHFREPGFPHKETWATGSRSAAAGGVTTVLDQPNTDPPTVTGEAVATKARLAADSLLSAPVTALGEVFLADSTGDMGIDADLLGRAVEHAEEAGVTVTVHAEDADLFDETARAEAGDGRGRDADADVWSAYRTAAAEVEAIERACEVASEVGTRVHVAHTSTPEGIDAANGAGMTCEVTPHHLFLSRGDLDDLGTFGRMNPPLRSEERREAVARHLRDGRVDVVATDHAPHTRAEKDAPILEAPSGVPGVETALPLLLNEAQAGRLSYERVRDLTAANPAAVFDLPSKGRIEAGADADLVLFDPGERREIRGEDLHSRCGWTPFEGWTGVFPELTLLRGRVIYDRRGAEEFSVDSIGENVRG